MIRSKIRKVKIFEIRSELNRIFHVKKSYFATRLQNKVFFLNIKQKRSHLL